MMKMIEAFVPVFTHDQFFKSEISRVIFALTHMDTYSSEENDGFIRLTDTEYYDKEKLNKWYHNLVSEIKSSKNDFTEADIICALNWLKLKYHSTCLIMQANNEEEE